MNGQNVPSLEGLKVVLIQCNLVANNYQQKSEYFIIFHPINLMLMSNNIDFCHLKEIYLTNRGKSYWILQQTQ